MIKNKYELKVDSLFEIMFPHLKQGDYNYFQKSSVITDELKKQYQQRLYNQHELAIQHEEKQDKFIQSLNITDGKRQYLESIGQLPEKKYKEFEEVTGEEKDETKLNLEYSNIKYMKKFGHDVKQSILVNKTESRELGHKGTFFTITLPSRFHPFRTSGRGNVKLPFKKWSLNPNFLYTDLDKSIKEGYLLLNSFLLYFMNKVKKDSRKYRKLAKKIKFNIVLEPHKSLIPHVHGVIFHSEELNGWIRQCFEKSLAEFNFEMEMNEKSFTQNLDGVDGVSNYIIKYIQKNLQIVNDLSDDQYEDEWFEERKKDVNIYLGWKMMLGNSARIHRSNRFRLSKSTAKKIYGVLPNVKGYKEIALQNAKDNHTCIRYEIMNDTAKRKVILEENQEYRLDEKDGQYKVYDKEYILDEEGSYTSDENGEVLVKYSLADPKTFKIKDYQMDKLEEKRFHVFELTRKYYKKQGFEYYVNKLSENEYRKSLDSLREEFKYSSEITKEDYKKNKPKSSKCLMEGINQYIENKSIEEKIKGIREEIHKIKTEDSRLTIKLLGVKSMFGDENPRDNRKIKYNNLIKEENENKKLLLSGKEEEILELEQKIDKLYVKGFSVQLIEVQEEIQKLMRIPEDAMILNEYKQLNELFELESELKKYIGIIERLYFVYYKTEELIITDMGEEILYDKSWYSN